MAITVRAQPYRLDPPEDSPQSLKQIVVNTDEMLQQLYEDLKIAADAITTLQATVATLQATPAATGGSPWVLLFTSTPTAVNSVDFTGLSGYTDIRVVVRAMTFGAVDRPQLRVSTDNGSTFLSASGDYVGISSAGAPTNFAELDFMDGDNTTSRNGEILLEGINMTTAPKVSRSNIFTIDNMNLRFMPTTSAVNAVRVKSRNGNNFTGGTIYVMGRV